MPTSLNVPLRAADELLAVPDGEDVGLCRTSTASGTVRKQIAVAARPDEGVRAPGANEQRPDDGLVGPRRTLILSARAWRLISARHASMSRTSSTAWIT
jgi:hypothetical protein